MGKRDRDERRGPPRQYDNRQARKQADRFEDDGLEGGGGNIWYGPRKKWRGKDKASSRCDPHVDAGATRGSEAGALEFCIFFARGACARGYNCHKLHFVPTPEDDAREDNMHDCFGRERKGVEDDDRDGAGCFLKENRTLWVGGVPVFDEASARERVRQNFGPWGRISSVRLVKNKSCAFVQYAHRASAEFAKEAMSNQALLTPEKLASNRAAGEKRGEKSTGPGRPPSSVSSGSGSGSGSGGDDGPVLHVRWAAEDPNPRAVIQARAGYAQTLLAAQVATGALPSDVAGRLPGADRALLRKAGMDPRNPSQVDLEFQNTQRQYLAVQGHGGANGEYPSTDHQYPNTDDQYPSTDHQYPNTDHQYPNTDHQYPNTDHQYPNTYNQYPNTDHQYPNTDNQYPNTGHHYPETGHQHRSTDRQHSSAGHQPPRSTNDPGDRHASTGAPSLQSTHRAGAEGHPAKPLGVGTSTPPGSSSSSSSVTKRQSLERRPPTSEAVGGGAAAAGGSSGKVEPVAGGSLSLLGGYGSGESE